jgi:signal peptidase II
MNEKKAIPFGICVVGLAILLDQLTKHLIRSNMTLGQTIPKGDSFFCIRYALNDGVAFSMFQGHRVPLIIIQSVLVIAILAVMLVVLRKMFSALLLLSFSLMLGGGLGNLIDRIAFGQVTDFISVGSFPIFNVADMSLTVGCGLMLLYVLLFGKQV